MGSTKLLVGFLGVLLTFSPDVLYHYYEAGGTRWGLTRWRTSTSPDW